MLLKQECMEQVRVAALLREELEVYKAKDQKRHKLVIKSNVSTQTERTRPSSLGYASEGSDGSTRSLISFHLGHGKVHYSDLILCMCMMLMFHVTCLLHIFLPP
ncbi:uncharacterized protein LOC103512319 [Diaphorina citri]|uniref:Uncharacterized protein LOC103512319 n=1 Tax=Diaphorina citri TaxID=121845 RepID=A0A3Q0J4I7_DIACI|nr:uncharacterized protein LOC103512319 [Diaphorina citri]